ncbi:transposase [Neosynechococcus sphagnicola sy1]|uniref:Transposase n=1 Tax=Neosynechococcus sphagnicola sy1 TaxID=1497020 RepID=A0A098TPB9_9CYAN|nr:IS630 transposase-related protein [Neosynechococcus sphagnicola]KGF73737.1 transposase [Neosynechococcus sphagnicola sy1]
MRAYSLELRQRIVNTYTAGNISIRKVAELFQVSKSTVQALLKQHREQGTLFPLPATGGRTSHLQGQENLLRSMVTNHPDYTLSEYCEDWADQTGEWVSQSTMCRWLQQQGLTLKKTT